MVTLTLPSMPVTPTSSGSVSSSMVAVYSPSSVTVTLHLPRSSLVAVSSKPPGPVTLTSTPATTSISVRIVPLMQPCSAEPAKQVSALAGEAAATSANGTRMTASSSPRRARVTR